MCDDSRRSLHLPVALAAALTALASMGFSGTAQAADKIAVDVDHTLSNNLPRTDEGWGAGVRLGHEWNLVLLKLVPEFGFSYQDFQGPSDANAWRAVAGGRLAIGLLIEPSAYVHVGVGHYRYDELLGSVSHTGFAYDGGVALDLTAIPIIDVGVHFTVAGISGNSDVNDASWTALGAHAAIKF